MPDPRSLHRPLQTSLNIAILNATVVQLGPYFYARLRVGQDSLALSERRSLRVTAPDSGLGSGGFCPMGPLLRHKVWELPQSQPIPYLFEGSWFHLALGIAAARP